MTFDVGVGLTGSLTRRSSVGVSGAWREMRLIDSADNDVRTYGAQATFNHRLTRTVGFHVGYGNELTQVLGASEAEPLRSHSMNRRPRLWRWIHRQSVSDGARRFRSTPARSVVTSGDPAHFHLGGNAGSYPADRPHMERSDRVRPLDWST